MKYNDESLLFLHLMTVVVAVAIRSPTIEKTNTEVTICYTYKLSIIDDSSSIAVRYYYNTDRIFYLLRK